MHHQSKAINKINAKLLPLWSKPTIIPAYTSPVTVVLADPKTGQVLRRAHVSQLKHYFNPNQGIPPTTKPNKPPVSRKIRNPQTHCITP